MYRVYQVLAGETIESIANKLNITPDQLVNLNGLVGEVVPGQLLVIPQEQMSIFEVYKVVGGDNMYEIARRFNVKLDDLLKINGLNKDEYIYPNQEILIPKPGVSIYVTVGDETLSDVAKKLGVTQQQLVEQNETIFLKPEQLIIFKKS